MTARPPRWLTLVLAPILATAMIVVPTVPAGAAPKDPPVADEDEKNPVLRDVLDEAGRNYAKAKAAYDKTTKEQLREQVKLQEAKNKRDTLLPEAGKVAAESYRTGSLATYGFLLNSSDSKTFFQRAVSLNEMNVVNDQKLQALNAEVKKVAALEQSLERRVKAQAESLATLQKNQVQAEKALSLVGGTSVTKGLVGVDSVDADPAPRTSGGDLPRESCSVPDPTTGGCITPRTFHMLKQAKKAGFDRFVGCHRSGGPFEHPKGRACDWSLQNSGFAPWHNDDTLRYGNELMAFLVRNAERLGVLYVIWNQKIWWPASGWKGYSGPSAHTDHVHVSML